MAENPTSLTVSPVPEEDQNDGDTAPSAALTTTPAKFLTGRIVTILVGSPPTEFSVHENVLMMSESEFFSKVFINGFEETQTGILKLPEDDVEAFQLFVHWAYGNAFSSSYTTQKTLATFCQDTTLSTLIKLYVLASKYTMKHLHDAVIRETWAYAKSSVWVTMPVTKEALRYFEENTVENCQMDQFLVDWMADGAMRAICNRLAREESSIYADECTAMFGIMPQRLIRAAFQKMHTFDVDNYDFGEFKDTYPVKEYLLRRKSMNKKLEIIQF